MKAVVNTSPLIFLAKLDRLDLLPAPCATTPAVLAEIRVGLAQGHGEALGVESLVERGRLHVRAATPAKLPREAGLDPAEASVLHLAVGLRVREVIVDDFAAIRSAKLLGLAPVSTPFLLLRARRDDVLTSKEFRELVERLAGLRYFLSPPLYQRLLEAGK